MYWFACACVVTVFGLRFNVGTDYEGYHYIFTNIDLDIYRNRFEPGFTLIAHALHHARVGAWVGFLLLMALTIIPIWRLIRRWSPHPTLSVAFVFGLSFVFFFSNGVRQGVAVALCTMAYPYVMRRDFRRFLAVVAVSMLFHYSAIVFALAYPVMTARLRPLIALGALGITLVVGYLGADGVIAAAIDSATSVLPIGIADRYDGMFNRVEGQLFEERAAGAGIRLLVLNALVASAVLLQARRTLIPPALVSISVVGQCVFNLFAGLSGPFRFWYYFGIFLVLLAPSVVACMRAGASRRLLYLVLMLVAIIFYVRAVATNHHNIIPYQFYFYGYV